MDQQSLSIFFSPSAEAFEQKKSIPKIPKVQFFVMYGRKEEDPSTGRILLV